MSSRCVAYLLFAAEPSTCAVPAYVFISSLEVLEDELLVGKEPLRVWCGCDGADSVGRDLTREQKQLFSQLVERAPSTRSLFIQLRVASATRVSAHNRLALLYCCAAAAISLCVSAPVREQIPKRAHTV